MKARKSKLKEYMSKWAVLGIGVTLTIMSAIITNYFIAQNNDEIEELEFNAARSAQLIEEIWENSRSMEAKKDNAIMLSVIAPDHPATDKIVSETMNILNKYSNEEAPHLSLNDAFDAYKDSVIEQIDNKYFEQTQYLRDAKKTKIQNDTLVNIALCFQILGLLFVLSRGYY